VIISEIRFNLGPARESLLGFVDILVDGNLKICGVGLHVCRSARCGIRLVFPSKDYRGGRLDIVRPITREAYDLIVEAVATEYMRLVTTLE